MVTSKFHYNAALSTSYKLIPIMRITSLRKTNGHCLGTFTTGDRVPCPTKCSVSHYLPTLLFSPLLTSPLPLPTPLLFSSLLSGICILHVLFRVK
jgi:hypothetical protein